MPEVDVAENLRKVQDRVAEAALRVSRNPSEITILGAAKDQPPERVLKAVEAGLTDIGHNYMNQAVTLMDHLKQAGLVITHHFIGNCGDTHSRELVRHFYPNGMIQSLDSLVKAETLNGMVGSRAPRALGVLIEVNVAGEQSKSGISPHKVGDFVYKITKTLSNLRVCGLMAMPPEPEEPEDSRPFFAEMAKIMADLQDKKIRGLNLTYLSMGTTIDYPVAVEEGATMVRIGTAIFGERSH